MSTTNPLPRALAALALALLVMGALAAGAPARTKVARYGSTVKLKNGNEGADITIADAFFHDGNTGSTKFYPGRNCENPFEFDGVTVDRSSVRCDRRSKWRVISARLGRGNDEIGYVYGWPWVRLRIDGGPGRDKIYGSYRKDHLSGGSGRDYIDASDSSRDRVNCGSGRDRVKISPGDKTRGCERIAY